MSARKTDGMTLIALIITIIMLILVSVSIRVAINGGLFKKAGQAVEELGNKQNEESILGNGNAKIAEASFWSADSNSNGCADVKENYDQFVWIPVANPNEM